MTTRDAKVLGKSDTQQLAYAVSQKRALLTHNRVDFEKLHREYLKAGRVHYGIIIARRSNEHTILKRLLRILNQVPADEMKNHLK